MRKIKDKSIINKKAVVIAVLVVVVIFLVSLFKQTLATGPEAWYSEAGDLEQSSDYIHSGQWSGKLIIENPGGPPKVYQYYSGITLFAYYPDADGDGFGDKFASVEMSAISPPRPGYAQNNTDCDDGDFDINPEATEVCDGLDNDCDLGTLDGSGETAPLNSKQAGVCFGSTQTCTGAGGWVDDYSGITGYEDPEVSCFDNNDNDCDSDIDCADSVDCSGTPCDDGFYCVINETCQAGACVGVARDCSDSYSCTDDSCNEDTDSCDNIANDSLCTPPEICDPALFPPPTGCGEMTQCTGQPDGTPCDDGDACTENDVCSAGICQPGTPKTCDNGQYCDGEEYCDVVLGCQDAPDPCSDGVICTSDCNEVTDSCESIPNDWFCDDGLWCDGAEYCDVTLDCQPGTVVDCDDGISCTDDSCNEGTDSCDNIPNDSLCTPPEICNPALFPPPTGCGEMGPCTGLPDGTPCDDGDACTENDVCSAGACLGTPKICDNGVYCDGEEYCDAGTCQDGPDPCPDDGVICTSDCNEITDSCESIPNDWLCDNGLYCDGLETCDAILGCQPGTPVDCSVEDLAGVATCNNDPDANPFTWDYREAFTSVCDEVSDSCTTGDPTITHTCDIVQCGAECETNPDCPPTCVGDTYYSNGTCGSDCVCSYTTEDCNSYDSWYDTGSTRWVDDGPCTEKEQKEQEYREYTCGASGCEYSVTSSQWVDTGSTRNKAEGTSCDNGLFCDGSSDQCDTGVCVGTVADPCSDGVVCTTDTCNEDTDSCEYTPNDWLCDNGLYCDGAEYCDVTLDCQTGTPIDCSALSDQCNDGICDESTDSCIQDPTLYEGLSCDDGEFCTGPDTCQLGVCTGPPKDLDGDGHVDIACGGDDCDDDPAACGAGCHPDPDAPAEVCDGYDNDCNGEIDEGDTCLVGYWKLDDGWGSQTLNDETNYNNDGFLGSGSGVDNYDAEWTQDSIKFSPWSLRFRLITISPCYFPPCYAPKYAQVPDNPDNSLDLTNAATIAFWLYVNEYPGAGKAYNLVSKWGPTNEESYIVKLQPDGTVAFGLNWSGQEGGDVQWVVNNTPVPLASWHYITAVYNGSEMRVYIDGALDSTPVAYSSDIFSGSAPLVIGTNGWFSADAGTKGKIDEIRIYKKALTDSEISYLYDPSGGATIDSSYQVAASEDDTSAFYINAPCDTPLDTGGNRWWWWYTTVAFGNSCDYFNRDNDYYSFLKWQIDVPKGATINDARIRVYYIGGRQDIPAKIGLLDDDGIWDSIQGFQSYADGDSLQAIPVISETLWQVNWWYGPSGWVGTTDISSLVQAFITSADYSGPGDYIGIKIRRDPNPCGCINDVHSFYGFDGDPNYAAKLEINYTP